MAGRAALLRRLGRAVESRPDLFGSPGRIGNLFDHLAGPGVVSAPAVLAALLDGFAPIWPGRLQLAGVGLGDVRSEEHTSELQSLMRISYDVFCLKKKKQMRKTKYR